MASDWLEDDLRFATSNGLPSTSSLLSVVLQKLRKVIDPDLQRDIVSLQFIKNLQLDYLEGSVSFDLCLTTPACPVQSTLVKLCEQYVKELHWVKTVNVTVGYVSSAPSSSPSSLAHRISYIIAVYSCKGGVGKSVMAVNLAYMLKALGAKVGILDADIYGPSLPFLIPLKEQFIYFQTHKDSKQSLKRTAKRHVKTMKHSKNIKYEDFSIEELQEDAAEAKREYLAEAANPSPIGLNESEEETALGMLPLEHLGVKLMSYGYIKKSGSQGFSGLRGPLASGIVLQMFNGTLWGDLDYLILDLPPGTGDIHLSIGQNVPLTAAVVVTTPQSLSVVDVEKGIRMFNELKVPTIAIVENMSYFVCDACEAKHRIFESQELTVLIERYGVGHHVQVPLHKELAKLTYATEKNGSDTEQEILYPFVAAFDEKSMLWLIFKHIAELIVREAAAMKFAKKSPIVSITDENFFEMILQKVSMTEDGESISLAEEILLAPFIDVRLECRCADCIDTVSGDSKLKQSMMDATITVSSLSQSGTYAVTIEWSDGHQSIMSFDLLERICKSYSSPLQISSKCLATPEFEW